MDNILYGMENQEVSNVLALDLSAAFDTVQHHIMLQTFNNYYGLSGKVLGWIGSYLSNRSCMVLVGNDYSEKKELPWSVLGQGSCTGAYYFIMYAATLFEEVDKNLADLYGFADDHILNNSFEASSRVQEMNAVLDLEDAAADVKNWITFSLAVANS